MYTNKVGMPVTTESLRDGLFVAASTGSSIEKSAVEAFLRTLYDSETKMFSPRLGGAPSVKATSEALESLILAGVATRDWPVKVMGEIKAHLQSSLKSGVFSFASTEGTESTPEREFENNAYAIMSAQMVDLPLATHSVDIVSYFSARSSPRGISASVGPTAVAGFEPTVLAIRALHALDRSAGHTVAPESITMSDGVMRALFSIPMDLNLAALAHRAFVHTPRVQDVIQFPVTLESAAGETFYARQNIISGVAVKPTVTVIAWNTRPHAGADVQVTISHKGSADKTFKLLFSDEHQAFVTEEVYQTEGKLGELSVKVLVQVPLAGGERIGLSSTQTFNLGYSMDVKASAKVAGHEIAVGEAVTVGTEFNFDVSLTSKQAITSGAFDLVFSVLDSSNVLVFQSKKDYVKQGAATVAFSYELKQADLPAGALTFKLHVLDHATNTVHTSQTFSYLLQLPMVATQIKIGDGKTLKPSFKLGETATVTMVPASFPDLVNVHTYAAVDANGEDATQRRAFFLDTTEAGSVLRTFSGVVSADPAGNIKVTFTVNFPAVFDAIGTHGVRFRYTSAAGKDFVLANYDSSASELLDDATELGFEVTSDLYITELADAPKGGSLSYGDLINFSFKIKDRITGAPVLASYESSTTPIYLALSHKDSSSGKSHISARHAVVADPRGGFETQWVVNPNAVSGKGTLQLLAVTLGGREIVLATEDNKPFGVDVVIGGDISHTVLVKQVSVPIATHAAALVEFTLSCQERRLSGALLTASLVQDGKTVATIPVVRSDNEAVYSVSWSIPESLAASAHYDVVVRRQADAASSPALITIPVAFDGATASYLPFRTEALILTAALVSFGVFSYRKYLIERK